MALLDLTNMREMQDEGCLLAILPLLDGIDGAGPACRVHSSLSRARSGLSLRVATVASSRAASVRTALSNNGWNRMKKVVVDITVMR